jgi:hypothetical protein
MLSPWIASARAKGLITPMCGEIGRSPTADGFTAVGRFLGLLRDFVILSTSCLHPYHSLPEPGISARTLALRLFCTPSGNSRQGEKAGTLPEQLDIPEGEYPPDVRNWPVSSLNEGAVGGHLNFSPFSREIAMIFR